MRNAQSKTEPAAQVRLGNINAAIWKNEGENGTWFNVTFARTYKEGSEYRSAQSFDRPQREVTPGARHRCRLRVPGQRADDKTPGAAV
jgi:hypothetical protein